MAITRDTLLEEIVQDLFRLTHIWETFRYLFTNDTHVAVMNAVSGGFFFMTQQLLFDDAILRVSKLTDPAGNKHQENMSLERLLQATDWETTEPTKWQHYRSRLDAVESACKPCRDHRNKRVSHKAMDLFTNAITIHDPMMKMINDARTAIHEFVHDIRIDLGHGSLSFEYRDSDRDARKLVDSLSRRASQQRPDDVSIITYDANSGDGVFYCAFCGEKRPMRYHRNGVPTGEDIARWHWATCHGVVGIERLAVETGDLADTEKPARFIVDLSVKRELPSDPTPYPSPTT
jgi:AbiU2